METSTNMHGLHNVRAIVLDPISGAPRLVHPDEINTMHDGEGVCCLGVVGTPRNVCHTFAGDFTVDGEPCILTVERCPALAATLCVSLLDEYTESLARSEVRALEQLYALPDLRGHIDA